MDRNAVLSSERPLRPVRSVVGERAWQQRHLVITGTQAGDLLAATASGTSITDSFSGSTLTLGGTDTVAHYRQVLESVAYRNTTANPTGSGASTSRTLTYSVFDGINTGTATSTVTVQSPPTVSVGSPSTTFTGGGAAVVTDAVLTVTDDLSTSLYCSYQRLSHIRYFRNHCGLKTSTRIISKTIGITTCEIGLAGLRASCVASVRNVKASTQAVEFLPAASRSAMEKVLDLVGAHAVENFRHVGLPCQETEATLIAGLRRHLYEQAGEMHLRFMDVHGAHMRPSVVQQT